MDDYNFKRSHVPAFGSWDCTDDLPFTQCFESARQAGLLRYSYSEDRDLYVAGDLYENDVVTPAMIVVPRRRGKARYPHVKEEKKEGWVVCDCDCDCDTKDPPSPLPLSPPPRPRRAPKAVDEDLYKISPELLHAKPKRKRVWGFLSSCLQPSCVH
ncbi:unnamed protein product [Ilex paraguariensis]|uniref:RIN4 pathogenic type III effector avirulence factor Avr cleavage site domain-containing protein n=1 Tax=Ilex paraguariensis TaxID=185542 RepID=A0ABC8R794_9AQUA